MKQKPYACFGYVLIANYYDKDEVFEVRSTSDSKTVLFGVKGRTVNRNKETGEVIEICGPGYYATEHLDMIYENTAEEDAICFCFDPKRHNGYVPPMDVVNMAEQESATLAAGTRLFLCQGTIKVDGKEFTGPCQVLLQGAKVITAVTDVYGLIIK